MPAGGEDVGEEDEVCFCGGVSGTDLKVFGEMWRCLEREEGRLGDLPCSVPAGRGRQLKSAYGTRRYCAWPPWYGPMATEVCVSIFWAWSI